MSYPMDFFLRNRWGIFEKQNVHSCEHFIFQNVLSFIITNFPCDTWLGIMGKKWKQKIMLGGGLCWLNTHEEVRYILISHISGMPHSKHITCLTHFYYFQQTTSYLWCGFLIIFLFFNLLYLKISFHVYSLVSEEITKHKKNILNIKLGVVVNPSHSLTILFKKNLFNQYKLFFFALKTFNPIFQIHINSMS